MSSECIHSCHFLLNSTLSSVYSFTCMSLTARYHLPQIHIPIYLQLHFIPLFNLPESSAQLYSTLFLYVATAFTYLSIAYSPIYLHFQSPFSINITVLIYYQRHFSCACLIALSKKIPSYLQMSSLMGGKPFLIAYSLNLSRSNIVIC